MTVFMLSIYLPRPINSRNTIMRKSWLAVVFLGSIVLKTLILNKMYSQVKFLLKTSIDYICLHCDYLTYLFPTAHTLLVVAITSCYCVSHRYGSTSFSNYISAGVNRGNIQ